MAKSTALLGVVRGNRIEFDGTLPEARKFLTRAGFIQAAAGWRSTDGHKRGMILIDPDKPTVWRALWWRKPVEATQTA